MSLCTLQKCHPFEMLYQHQSNIVTVTSHHFNANEPLRYHHHMPHHCMIHTNRLNGMKMVLLKQWWHVMLIPHTKYRDCIVIPHHHITPINWGFAIIPHRHTSQTNTTLLTMTHWSNTTTSHDLYQTFRWHKDSAITSYQKQLKQWWHMMRFYHSRCHYTLPSHHTNQLRFCHYTTSSHQSNINKVHHTTIITFNHWNNNTTSHYFYKTFRWHEDSAVRSFKTVVIYQPIHHIKYRDIAQFHLIITSHQPTT
jgi:hypothetical protein